MIVTANTTGQYGVVRQAGESFEVPDDWFVPDWCDVDAPDGTPVKRTRKVRNQDPILDSPNPEP